jgi:hypothetical protein
MTVQKPDSTMNIQARTVTKLERGAVSSKAFVHPIGKVPMMAEGEWVGIRLAGQCIVHITLIPNERSCANVDSSSAVA